MSENNSTILYAGLDVAKATLQLDLRGVSYRLHNTKKDHARLLRLPFGHELIPIRWREWSNRRLTVAAGIFHSQT